MQWYGKSNLLGTVADETIKGLRLRKSGILIGDRFLLNELFKEDRFNGWVQGEVLVFDDKIIPNARRDDFEKNAEYIFLIEKLKGIAIEISNEIRSASQLRGSKKNKLDTENIAEQTSIDMNVNEVSNTFKQDNLKEEFGDLFDKFDNEDDLGLCEKIEQILKEELNNDEVAFKIMGKIKNMIDKNK